MHHAAALSAAAQAAGAAGRLLLCAAAAAAAARDHSSALARLTGSHSAPFSSSAASAASAQEPTPGQAFLASLIDYEKQGVPKAAGTAITDTASSSSGGGDGVQPAPPAPPAPPQAAAAGGGFDLAIMRRLLAALGDPQATLPVVHIAGTKGKGSVAALLSGVLRAAGYRVGTYTSPHLFDIRERVVLGGGGGASSSSGGGGGSLAVPPAMPVSEQAWEALALQAAAAVDAMTTAAAAATPAQHEQQQNEPQQRPSHFEVVTAMALTHFVQGGADIAVIETGLGGARDATNVFAAPQLQASVLTAVGLDHVDALGGSLASIAAAKAGIIKAGAPAIVAPQDGAGGAAQQEPGAAAAACGGGISSGGSSSGETAQETVLRVFREAAGRPGVQAPLLLAADFVRVLPGHDSSSSDGRQQQPAAAADSGAVTILPGPGPHLARQHISLIAQLDAAAAAAAVVQQQQHAAAPLDLKWELDNVALQLVGRHQGGNVQAAVAAALVLAARGWGRITADAVRAGLQAAWLPGRFQVVQLPGSPTRFVLDGAHTSDSAAALAATLRAAFPAQPVVLVVAMAGDKQHRDVLLALRRLRPSVVVFTSVPIAGSHARSAPPGTLAAHWQAAAMLASGGAGAGADRPFRCRELIQAGLGAALDKARHELGAHGGRGVVCVTGSLHAVAAASKALSGVKNHGG